MMDLTVRKVQTDLKMRFLKVRMKSTKTEKRFGEGKSVERSMRTKR